MVVSCCAYGCTERFKKDSGIIFHRFPIDENQRKKWIIAVKLKDFKTEPWKRLCSKHFLPEDYQHNFGKVTLVKTAVPSIFAFPEDLQKRQHTVSRKRPRKHSIDDSTITTKVTAEIDLL